MKKFEFSLQTVLNVENIKKTEMMNTLSSLRSEISFITKERDNLQMVLDQEADKLYNSKQTMRINKINEFNKYKEYMEYRVKQCNDNILRLKEESKKVTNEIITCNRRIDVLEKIKKRKRSEYDVELAKEEEQVIQEIIQTRYIYNKGTKEN